MIEVLMMGAGAPEGPPPPPGAEFLGEVPTVGFINGSELATAINLRGGNMQHSDSPWLHFILDDVELYVAKKPYRHSVTWDNINAAGAVFGSKTVEINGRTYKVRLLKSVATGNVYTGNGGYDLVAAYGSEWNRLFYPIHSGNHTHAGNPSLVSGEGLQFGTLAQYTDIDLLLHYTVGTGHASWCQETPSNNGRVRVTRGSHGVSYSGIGTSSFVGSDNGWRPVLELVE